MEIKKRLLMSFKTNTDKKISLAVDSPRTDLTEAEIKAAMNIIISKDIFAPSGESLVSLLEAKIVQTDTTAYDLEL